MEFIEPSSQTNIRNNEIKPSSISKMKCSQTNVDNDEIKPIFVSKVHNSDGELENINSDLDINTKQINIGNTEIKPMFMSEIYSSDDEHGSINSDLYEKKHYISDSEQSINSLWDEDGNKSIKSEEICYYGQASDKYKWITEELDIDEKKINIDLPSLTNYSAQLGDAPEPIDVWNLFFTDSILQEIVIWTNYKIAKQRVKYKTSNWSDIRNTEISELKALLGLLIYTSALNANHEDVSSLFASDGTGREIFRCVSTSSRFSFLLGCLAFANPDDKEERKTDSAAAISSILNAFIQNCQAAYSPGMDCCIDDILVPFKGECKFKAFMPNKTKRYGIKLTCLTDASNSYFYNSFIDTGEQLLDNKISDKATKTVLHLTRPIWETYKTITAGTQFSSAEVCQELGNHGLTYVGTLKKNRREIPKAFLLKKGRPIGSSLYGFFDKIMLISYIPKENKVILLISTKHHHKLHDLKSKVPDVKTFYDRTKESVEMLDKKISSNTCSRRVRRWPTAIFYRLLDISTINAQILHELYKDSESMSRINFLKKIARSLVQGELEQRVTKQGLRRDLRMTIRRILGDNFGSNQVIRLFVGKLEKRKRCSVCPNRKNRKTSYACYLCGYPMCMECSQKVCKICFEDPI